MARGRQRAKPIDVSEPTAGGRKVVKLRVASTSETLGDYAARFLGELRRHHRVNKRTAENYARSFRLHLLPLLGHVPLAALTRAAIRAALVALLDRSVGPSAVRNGYIALASCLTQAVEDGKLEHNPSQGSARRLFRRGGFNVKSLTRGELERFLSAVPVVAPGWEHFVFTLLGTGARVSEALALMPGDVDVERRSIRIERQWIAGEMDVPKGRRTRVVQVDAALVDLLTKRAAAVPTHRFLFQHPTKAEPWHASTVRNTFTMVSTAAGLRRVTPHQIRHTAAVLMLEATGDLLFVQRMLGHADPGLTANLYGAGAKPRHPEALETLAKLRPRPGAADALVAKWRSQ